MEIVMGDRNGWIICVASVFQLFIKSGMLMGFGTFIAEFNRLYKTKMAELDWMAVLPLTLTGLSSPIPSFIIHRIGKKGYAVCSFIGTFLMAGSCIGSSFVSHVSWLFFTFSILTGFASSFIFMSSTLIVHEFFPADHRFHVLTTTAFQLAIPLAIMTSSPLFAWIIQLTSWRTAFVTEGIMMLVTGATCSMLFLLNSTSVEILKPLPDVPADKSNSVEDSNHSKFIDSNWKGVCGTANRFLWLFGVVLSHSSLTIPLLNLPHYMETQNYGKMKSTMPLVSYSISQIVGFIIFSSIGRYMKGKFIYGNIASCMSSALLFVIWAFVDTPFVVIMILSAVAGAASMLFFSYLSPSSMEVMSMNIKISWTATSISSGIGRLLSPLLSGAIYDFRQSYDDVFLVAGIVCFFNGLIFVAIPVIDVFKKKANIYESLS